MFTMLLHDQPHLDLAQTLPHDTPIWIPQSPGCICEFSAAV